MFCISGGLTTNIKVVDFTGKIVTARFVRFILLSQYLDLPCDFAVLNIATKTRAITKLQQNTLWCADNSMNLVLGSGLHGVVLPHSLYAVGWELSFLTVYMPWDGSCLSAQFIRRRMGVVFSQRSE